MAAIDKIVKGSFIFYVLFLGILCAATTIFAAWLLIELLGYAYFLSPSFASGPVIALLIGGIVLLPIIVVIGFRAFSQKQQTLAIVFWVGVAVAAVLCISLGVWSMILRFRLHDQLEVQMKRATPPAERNDFEKKQWDYVQRSLKCCGTTGVSDYVVALSPIPLSCCDVVETVCARTHAQGCITVLNEFGATKLTQVALAAAVLAVSLFIGIYAGCIFSSYLRKSNKAATDASSRQENIPLRTSTMNHKIFLKDQYDLA